VARAFGFWRILLANQLVGRQAIRYVLDELGRDPGFDFEGEPKPDCFAPKSGRPPIPL
jgi:hypothetical protein